MQARHPSTALAAILTVLVAGAVAVAAQGSGSRIEVAPGSIVRWAGEGLESCGMSGSSWEPIGESCWYPIDLLQEAGNIPISRTLAGVLEEATVVVGTYPYPKQELEVEARLTDPPEDQHDRIRREQQRVVSLWGNPRPAVFQLPLHPPLDPLPSARNFGSRRIFNGQPRGPHTGADFSAPAGTPVLAAASGTVVLAGDQYYAGNSIFIDHGHELITMYFHLEELQVHSGQAVKRGQPIGTVGATGRATGAHLHFGARWHGARIDPELLLGTTPTLGNRKSGSERLARHPSDSL